MNILNLFKREKVKKEMPLTDPKKKLSDELFQKRRAGIEVLYKAFVEETGLPPSRTEFVEDRTDTDKTSWYYRELKTKV